MTRRAVNAFVPPPRSASADTPNMEGFAGFSRSLKERYLQTLLTNTFGSAFYADAKEMLVESVAVHDAMLAEDPYYAAKALVFARERGYMRTQPIYGLARLFGVNTSLAAAIFGQVIKTPNDLADFTAIIKAHRKGEGGRAIKRAAGRWLVENLNDYWVIKYGAEKGAGTYSLKDMLQVYHPKAKERLPLFDYIMGGIDRVMGTPAAGGAQDRTTFTSMKDVIAASTAIDRLNTVNAFEALKAATTEDEKARLIAKGGLPHEVATSFAGSSKKVWSAIVPNLPIFALLRNLATLERHGVAAEHRTFIEGKLLDPHVIEKSKILPFRFVEAIKHVQLPWLADALRGALDLACNNVPDIPGITDVALDVSGSMQSYIQTAAVFGICVARKSNLSGHVYGFNTQIALLRTSLRDSILSQAEKIYAGGGTDHSLVPRYLMQERRRVDNLVYITDEQQNVGAPLVDMIDEYRQRVNPNLKLFVVDVGPYSKSGSLVPASDPKTWFVYGWSDQVLNFIALAAQGFGSLVEVIEHS